MIRPYKYKYSKIQEVQSFVNYIVLEIMCKAPQIVSPEFSSNLVLEKYKELIDEINTKYILTPLKEAFVICKNKKPMELKILKRALHNNNRIRELCNGDMKPVLYNDIDKIDKNLSKSIKTFCDYLYDEAITKEAFYTKYEKIEEYYKKIVGKSSTCYCCGINKVLTQFHTKRSALDHYLPRQDYPFTSINFKNLVPICDTCNSKYKLGENTLFIFENRGKKNESKKRVKAFYPFRRDTPNIIIEMNLNVNYSQNVLPTDFEIKLKCVGYEEQVESWDRMFGIKENYLAQCCTDEMYSYYEEQYIADINYGKSHDEYIDMLSRNKFGDMNFLKIAFLEAIK